MSKNKLFVNIAAIIDIHSYLNIPIIIYNKSDKTVLNMCHILKQDSTYTICKHLIQQLDLLYKNYNFDTIIFEKNQLFIDKIDRHPDLLVMHNIILGYALKISIDNKYHDTVNNIIELPEYEWRKKVLNSSTKYSIDLYKSHIELQDYDTDSLQIIKKNNYYKVLCLSESIWFDTLMSKQYQINKGD